MASAVLSPNADTRERSKSSGGLLGNDMDSRVGDSRLRVELRQANYRADELKTELSSAKDVCVLTRCLYAVTHERRLCRCILPR